MYPDAIPSKFVALQGIPVVTRETLVFSLIFGDAKVRFGKSLTEYQTERQREDDP
jgi:hypothetical protein